MIQEDEFETEWTRIDGKSSHQLICSWRQSQLSPQAGDIPGYPEPGPPGKSPPGKAYIELNLVSLSPKGI